MGFYLIGPLVTLIPLGSISFWAFKPYCDDGLLGISPTGPTLVFKQAAICIALRKKKIPLVGARMKAKGIMHN